MRIALPALAAACLLAPIPSLAADADSEPSEIAKELADPAMQAQVVVMVEAMTNVLLEMPAAPFLRAAATMQGGDPEAIDEDVTVGELAGPEAAEAPREMAERLPQMMGAMAMLATSLEAMLPQLREAAERIEDATPRDYGYIGALGL